MCTHVYILSQIMNLYTFADISVLLPKHEHWHPKIHIGRPLMWIMRIIRNKTSCYHDMFVYGWWFSPLPCVCL